MQQVSIDKAQTPGVAAIACLFLVGSLLAISLSLAKLAVAAGAPPLGFLLVSLTGAGAILLFVSGVVMRAPMVANRRILEYGLVAGALFALPNAIGFLAVRHVGAGFLSLSFAFPILITYVLALLIGMERPRIGRVLGVLAGLAGGVILAVSKVQLDQGALFWIALVMCSPVIIAVANIYRTLRWPPGAAPIYLAALMLLGAALLLAPFAIWTAPDMLARLVSSPAIVWLVVMETLVFFVLYLFYFILQKIAGPVYLSQIGTVGAVVGAALALVFLGEALPRNIAFAAALIGFGTWMFQLKPGFWRKS